MLLPFELHTPESLTSASSLLKERGEDATVYAGGTELLLVMKAGFVHRRDLVDIKPLPGLRGIRHDPETRALVIGATTTHRDIERSPLVIQHLPVVAAMASRVANVRVRNQGTIGGNLCFAEPHSDPATLFIALDATVVLSDGASHRVLALADFIVDAYATAIGKGELLTEVRLPLLLGGAAAAYKKFGVHERPTVGVAAVVVPGGDGAVADVRIVVGSVGAKPTRVTAAEDVLKGATADRIDTRVDEAGAAAAAAVDPVDDLHGAVDYKRHLVSVFVRRALHEALASARAARGA